MTQSYTITETWSLTHARYVGGKVAADLRQMQQAYGRPWDREIEQYTGELVPLLNDGYLDTVTYGFKRNDIWLPATLRYTALSLGISGTDDRSGSITRGTDISGAGFYSYLTYSPKWWSLTPEARANYSANLPVQRTSANEPNAPGGWVNDKSYVSGGGGVQRAKLGGTP